MDRPPHLDIDLNEAPSPPPSPPPAVPLSPPREFALPIFAPLPPLPPPAPLLPPPPPPAPVNSQAQLLLAHEAREIALRLHQAEALRVSAARALAAAAAAVGSSAGVPQPAQHPGEAGWGHPPLPCASCGRPEIPGATIVCDACERGFHESCVRVWPPLMSLPPAPPPGPPGVRRPPVAVNEDWMCPECEMHGARSTRWRLGPVPLDINAAPPEDPVTVAVRDITRVSVADGAHLTEFATELPHFEGLLLKNTTLFDANQFMQPFGIAHCFNIRQQFPPTGRDFIADGNIEQRANHTRRKRRDFPQTSTLPKFAETHEFGSPNIFMDPSYFTKATELSSTEERTPLKPPKFLVDCSNRRPDHHTVGLPVQYGDFFITSLGEIDKRASYHNCHQIWPVGFTSYWHDRITGSLFECEVSDGGSFGPLFKVRRLPCSVFPLPEASTILSQNGVRKADTTETKESSSFIGDTAIDTYDNIAMLLSDPSETNQDFFSCLTSDTEYKKTSLGGNYAQNSNMMAQIPSSHSENVSQAPDKEANINDQIGDFTFEGTSSSSVWRMISCAMMEACEKMYKQHGHLVFLCTHSSENPSLNKGIGCQNFAGHCAPLTRFCSSSGPSIPRVVEKNDVESTYKLLKEWLYQDRIGLDLEFVQEIVESLPRSRACLNYQFLSNRAEFVSSMTVASGSLTVVHKDGQSNGGMSYGRHGSAVTGLLDNAQPIGSSIRELPPGHPISHKLPPELAGDVFQIWEFLGHFAEIVCLKEVPSYEQLEDELIDPWPICANQKEVLSVSTQHYRDHSSPMNFPANGSISHSNGESGLTNNEDIVSVFVPVENSSTKDGTQDALVAQTLGRCSGVVLPGVHLTLFKVLLGELLSKVSIFVDPNIDPKESKPRRGRKKDTESLISTKELNFDMLISNTLTWPELARRYILAVSSIRGCMDLSDISSREGVKLFRCLQGDGGILCGALPGVAGMEKDALLLLEAENLLCSSPSNDGNKVFMMDYKDTDMIDSAEVHIGDNRTLPDWAEPLEPVRKLPTNVGTRIRKCVYEALERKPPEWARKILEHAISKEVYKGNASGPTKKAVLSVLTEACRAIVPQKIENPRKGRKTISFSEGILRKCRIALRSAISSDESKLFGNLLGTTLMNSNENEDDGILGFPGMVSRPLDFRTIDIRLAMGAYCGSWETFSEDVQEVIRNLHIAYADRTDVVEMVVALSQSFESLYKTEVLDLVEKFEYYLSNTNSEIHKELHGILTAATNLPKAPWEDGVCKVCGIDRDDDSVLLCDKCDSEYHTYCLNPPLARIPQGNWYCPSCASGQKKSHLDQSVQDLKQQGKKHVGEESHAFHKVLSKLAAAMEEKEYWDLSPQERINLLKFLCDEMLNTALIREHIDQCADKLNDLQQKFRSLNFELKDLKYKEEIRASYARQSRWSKTEQHFNNCSGVAENQQNDVAIASGHLEEAEQGNTGVNLNHPAEGAPPGQLDVGKSCRTDNDISMIEEHKSLGLSEQPSETASDIEVVIIDEGSQSSREMLLGGKGSACDNFNSVDTPIAERAPVASPLSTPAAELPDENVSTSFQDNLKTSTTRSLEHAADNDEMDTLSDEISKLQDSIATVESQLNMASLRRDCLGKDSLGRLYWVLGRPGKRPLLIADGSMLIRKERDISMINSYPLSTFDCKGWNSASVFIYESDEEIQGLVDWLREYDPREKELKDAILQWQRHLYHQGSFPLSDPSVHKLSKSDQFMDLPNTKAAVILEQKYGLRVDQDRSDLSRRQGRKTKSGSEERAYRCDCLEPVWPARHHCLTCHETYFTSTDYERHNSGKCNTDNHSPSESKENDEPKVKGPKSDIKEKDSTVVESSSSTKLKSCPYDFEEICRKFVTNDSNKEMVDDIGLIGSNGVPSFVPSPAFFLEPAVILNKNKKDDIPNDLTSSLEECQAMSAQRLVQEGSKSGQNCSGNTGDENVSKSTKPTPDSTSCEEASSATDKPTRLLAVNGGLVPESSLMPVIGRNTHILNQQKINLLDIDAALPEEALRASKSQQIRRRSWRTLVKDAESISEMVLATSLLESMIKAEFLKNDWWYWSSFTVAMKTSTVSALALRIYTLDDCIIYAKDPNTEPADSTKVVNKGRRRKEPEPSAS